MTEDEKVGWHHWLSGHEFEHTLRNGEGQGSLACCSPWGHKKSNSAKQLNNNSTYLTRLLSGLNEYEGLKIFGTKAALFQYWLLFSAILAVVISYFCCPYLPEFTCLDYHRANLNNFICECIYGKKRLEVHSLKYYKQLLLADKFIIEFYLLLYASIF